MLGFGNEGHLKIWLDSHVILWREGKYTSMYKYVLHRPFCVWLKAKNSNCVGSEIKHYFKCKISQSSHRKGGECWNPRLVRRWKFETENSTVITITSFGFLCGTVINKGKDITSELRHSLRVPFSDIHLLHRINHA